MSAIYKYKFYCDTESAFVYTWSRTEPTVCPNNNTHSVDLSNVSILDTVSSNIVDINQEVIDTGGNYRAQSGVITAGSLETTQQTLTWQYTITVMNFSLNTDENADNCKFEAVCAENTIIGALTQNASINDTVLHVSPTVVQNVKIGYKVCLFNGVTQTCVGECVNVGVDTITIDSPLVDNHSAGVYVQMSIIMVKDFHTISNKSHDLAKKTVKGSTIFPGIAMTVRYTNNNTGGNVSKLQYTYEYLY